MRKKVKSASFFFFVSTLVITQASGLPLPDLSIGFDWQKEGEKNDI